MYYKKKPIVVQAIQFKDDAETIEKISEFIGIDFSVDYTNPDNPVLKIPTLEGVMYANVDDYIIKSVKNELYPCKPDIFKETYEEVR